MHSSTINKTQFHYNSDMSGKVIIIAGKKEIEVDGKDLIAFVLDRLRDEKISQLEQMSASDLKKQFCKP